MNIFWGDLHNHCNISYGYGSLTNALERAKEQLDFVAITGHAMWPDMYERNEETAFTVDFHNYGFKKLSDHWNEIRKTIANANSKELITFQAYEMHSSKYGDHHIVSPSDELPLIYRDSPSALKRDVGVPALVIAHHIGYTPGYRGIDWNLHDENVTPLVEVFSKHGCSMYETAPYPYYHNMGPRDTRNTFYEGLTRGYHMGIVGSTDHHAGYPGSYGDGRLAVIATDKSREAIWEALINRRTYAVTGDKIKCRFYLNDSQMGSIVPLANKRHLSFKVEADYQIDRIVIFKNLKPIHIIDGMRLDDRESNKHKFRIEMGWGNNEDKPFKWEGSVKVKGGKLLETQPAFRGRSVLAPSENSDFDQMNVNNLDNRIIELTDNFVSWQCYSFKNITTLHPQTQQMIFEIESDEDTKLIININGYERQITIGELKKYGYSEHMKPYHSQAFKVHTAIGNKAYELAGDLEDVTNTNEPAFYHMQVSQTNNQWAFVSPIYME